MTASMTAKVLLVLSMAEINGRIEVAMGDGGQ
jgi:hypothetical protein